MVDQHNSVQLDFYVVDGNLSDCVLCGFSKKRRKNNSELGAVGAVQAISTKNGHVLSEDHKMEALQFRTISNENEIDYFLTRFESYVGVKLPYDYAQRSTFVAGFKGNEMVAGYMLVTKPEFRSLVFVPDSVKKEHEFFKNDAYDMMEINGLWMSASLKTAAEQFSVWLNLVIEAFKCR